MIGCGGVSALANPGPKPPGERTRLPRRAANNRAARLVFVLLAVGTLLLFGRLARYPFVAIDDGAYLTDNPQVRAGLSAASFRWAWSTFHEANWHPLTWLSHLLDVSIFGLNPAGHHLVGVLLHLANSLLLFQFLRTLTGRLWAGAGVAALFAIHPLHVESVAWVAERKDLLSALFFFLTLSAYQRQVRQPSPARAALVPALFALALLAKPMVVTLPVLLLLLDWWPLGRFVQRERGGAPVGQAPRWSPRGRVLREKIPLLVLALASAGVTLVAQSRGGAVRSLEWVPLGLRLENAVVSVLRYLGKTFWPQRLAVFYPHPGDSLAGWLVAGAALVIGVISVAALLRARRSPAFACGWSWFLVTLLPVIGLVQVGNQALADRYTYLPLIGIFLLVCWGLPSRPGPARRAAVAVPVASIVLLAGLAWVQIGRYRSNEELFRHTLAVTAGNYVIHTNLGALYLKAGDPEAAEMQYRMALEARPGGAFENFNLGDLLLRKKHYAAALPYLRRALAIDPGYAKAHYYLGLYLAQRGAAAEARFHLGEALRGFPDDPVLRAALERLAHPERP